MHYIHNSGSSLPCLPESTSYGSSLVLPGLPTSEHELRFLTRAHWQAGTLCSHTSLPHLNPSHLARSYLYPFLGHVTPRVHFTFLNPISFAITEGHALYRLHPGQSIKVSGLFPKMVSVLWEKVC